VNNSPTNMLIQDCDPIARGPAASHPAFGPSQVNDMSESVEAEEVLLERTGRRYG